MSRPRKKSKEEKEEAVALIKQDINFLEYPMWFLSNLKQAKEEEFVWTDMEGYTYRTNKALPLHVDIQFLSYFLYLSQQGEWSDVVKTSRYATLQACGKDNNSRNYRRLLESIERWRAVDVEFTSFYRDSEHKFEKFRIISDYSITNNNELKIFFSANWLAHIRNSRYYKWVNLDVLRALSPLALRLYEILSKSFQGRKSFDIEATRLAVKMTMKEGIPSRITARLKKAMSEINDKTSNSYRMEIHRAKRGRVLLTFRSMLQSELELSQAEVDSNEVLQSLLGLVPESKRVPGVEHLLERYVKREGMEYTRSNLDYALVRAKGNFYRYLRSCLDKNHAGFVLEGEEVLLEGVEEGVPVQGSLPFVEAKILSRKELESRIKEELRAEGVSLRTKEGRRLLRERCEERFGLEEKEEIR